MRHMNCLLSPARVLHRVLLLQLVNTTTKTNAISSLPNLPYAHTGRQAVLSAPWSFVRAIALSRATTEKPTGEDIPYQWVQIREGEKTLSPPMRLQTVLARLAKHESLVMLAAPPPLPLPTPGAPLILQPRAAICRIINLEELEAKELEAERESKFIKKYSKTLEINWSTAPHDLGHKLKRLTGFLAKGMRVEILLARKKGTKPANSEQCQAVVERIQEVLEVVPGSTEYKNRDGVVGRTLKIFYEGPVHVRKKILKDGTADTNSP